MDNKLTQNNIILRQADEADWENYVRHLSEADEFYVQYGMEPTPELIEMIRNMNPDVIYYSIILKKTDEMVGYVGIAPDNHNIEFYVFKTLPDGVFIFIVSVHYLTSFSYLLCSFL